MSTMTEERVFCQSCGMPMEVDEDFGTNSDGSKNVDYCRYCYQGGKFTAPDMTMEQMLEFNLKFNEENGFPFGPTDDARRMLSEWMPTMKRWSAK